MIFCLGEGRWESKGEGYQKNYRAWNKDVSEKRYEEILKKCREILKDFKLDPREGWTKEWSKVTASQWKQLSEIKEFDLEITKKITGLSEIPNEDTVEVTCEGKTVFISKDSAKELNLI